MLVRGVAHLIPRPKGAAKAKGGPTKFDPNQLLKVLGSSDPRKIRASGVVEFEPKKG